jgi:hypothetical protein
LDGLDKRADVDAVGNFTTFVDNLRIAFADADNQSDKDAALAALNAAEIIERQIIFHNRNIDSIEIQATYENTLLLLCPFGTTGLDNVVRGQGCDNIDQNCDGIYDDCIEDQTPPEISLKATSTKVFTTQEEAKAFLEANLEVVDDCSKNLTTPLVNFLSVDAATAEGTFEVTVQDLRCPDNDAASTTVETFVIGLDDAPPVVTCGFSIPQDPFHVQDAGYDPLTGGVPPFPAEGETLFIDPRNFDGDLAELNMYYAIEEVRTIG